MIGPEEPSDLQRHLEEFLDALQEYEACRERAAAAEQRLDRARTRLFGNGSAAHRSAVLGHVQRSIPGADEAGGKRALIHLALVLKGGLEDSETE